MGERRGKTDEEIQSEGMDALLKALGPADMVRFLQMFGEGHGDYTKERRQWLKKDVHEIGDEIRDMKSGKMPKD